MKSRRSGFTLIELMVVIVILGILATVLIVNLGDRDQPARQAVTKALLRELNTQLAMFRLDHHRTPEGLDDLVFRPAYVDPGDWTPYLTDPPRDGWGHEFVYRVPGSDGFSFDVVSHGSDGQPGGEGHAQDLWNHARRE